MFATMYGLTAVVEVDSGDLGGRGGGGGGLVDWYLPHRILV